MGFCKFKKRFSIISNKKRKKAIYIFSLFFKILFSLFLAIFIFFVLYYSFTKFIFKDNIPNFLGYSFIIAVSNSMEPAINSGDLLIVNKKENYVVGDIVAFINDNNQILTHRIIEIDNNNYITKGDNAESLDSKVLSLDKIVGSVNYVACGVGDVLLFLKSGSGIVLILCIVLCISYFKKKSQKMNKNNEKMPRNIIFKKNF